MDFGSVDSIQSAGFMGFKSISDLHRTRCVEVPRVAGVYMILRDAAEPPRFRAVSTGGHFKGRNPTVPEFMLVHNWVDGATVLYIGKAGGGTSRSVLQKRLYSYLRFGAGEPVGHWGGRLIWQLEDSDALLVSWKPCEDVDTADLERSLIQDFVKAYGKRPLANLRD
ncbi:MAG: hypothetical protein RDU41_01730 [Clostridia bacterium]|nr:hypothetical protein [Clostridia bacterium]